MAERKAVTAATRSRYQQASKKEKGKILAEFIELTGITSSKALLRYFGSTLLHRIDSHAVEKYKGWRARQRKTARGRKSGRPAKNTKQIRPATVNRELACLKHLFTRNDSLIPLNPVSKVKFLDEDNEQLRVES